MADQSGSNLTTPRAHRRQISRTQRKRDPPILERPSKSRTAVLTRTSTNDPLAVNDLKVRSRSTTPAGTRSPGQHASPLLKPQTPSLQDFSFLLRSEIYHPLNNVDSVVAFRTRIPVTSIVSSHTIPELLRTGQFRQVAIAATNRITSPPPPPPAELFQLFYLRLTSLMLLDATEIAAAESLALGDLTSSAYVNPETGENVLPWSLRLVATRLQSLSASEPRRALTGYYDLAAEARSIYSKTPADDGDARLVWKARLRDLGVRVANSLVEMGDWEGGRRHLQSLRSGLGEGLDGREEDDMLRGRMILILLRTGDLESAKGYLNDTLDTEEDGDLSGSSYVEALRPLLSLAQGNYPRATNDFRSGLMPDALARQNRAICAVYGGRLNEARDLLQSLVDDGVTPKTVIFNLSTAFELLSDKARNMKLGLAETLADREGTAQGWETVPARFKLTN